MAKDSYGTQLASWREKAGMNQAELARRAKLSANYISNLERDFSPSSKDGKPHPSQKVVDRIAHIVGWPLTDARLAAGYAPPNRDRISESNKLIEAAHKFDALPAKKRPEAEPLIDVLNRELDRLARED